MTDQADIAAAQALFESVERAFPALRMTLGRDGPQLDLWLEIPRQDGLAFDVSLNLQGDELHLNAGALWLRWFPCTQPDVAACFQEAVIGLLGGRFRIVEYLRGERVHRAELQRPTEQGWQTIGTRSTPRLPFGRRHMRVLQSEPERGGG